MSRLGVLYALDDNELEKLRSLPSDERYDYVLEVIEEDLFGTPRGCELEKSWEGIQYCLGHGEWNEDNDVPTNIIFGGEFLLDTEDNVITLKNNDDVKKIVSYLQENNLREIIKKYFWKIDDPEFPYKDENGLNHILGWSKDILPFYENALKENRQVIFTVDL
ncbi:YfbM family protein [Xylocopilactobacillus apicola]|uniref:DUF1877 family protein n=1 Tax=Xylocopilactobacillus apicola TaxID=2932184 RepID=A0AAU9DQT9_9LACO|nr:YfbM family protein [Xylocopilactobacillus apicola]BDR59562.1 hypothetical protein XA3_20030 [Xylocopilactobacillus apicola]